MQCVGRVGLSLRFVVHARLLCAGLSQWMAMEAYEAAERGDYTIINSLHELLKRPYDEQGAKANERWAQVTPHWARDRAGLAYMT